jgi:hypothetical protein
MITPRNEWQRLKPWWRAFWHATPVTALVLGLFYHWFAVADRYIVFLYNHDYITDSDNFFARNGLLQVAIFALTATLAVGLTRLRRSLADRLAAAPLARRSAARTVPPA